MNASLFFNTIDDERIKGIAIFRSYIPDADPDEVAAEKELRCHGVLSNEETMRMVNKVKVGETMQISEIIAGTKLSKAAARDRINRNKRFKRVGRGFYRRLS